MAAVLARDIAFTRWLFRAFLLLLFLAPLPLGSNRPLFWSVLTAGAAIILMAWSAGTLAGVARWPNALRRAKWALLALLLFLLWAALQLLPHAWSAFLPVPEYLGSAYLAAAAVVRRSADVQASADALLQSLGLVFLAALTLLLVRSRRRAQQVLWTLVLAGLIQAVYGSLMVLSGLEFGFLEVKEFGRGVATGTFINRNHYANLLVLALAAGIGLMLSQMDLRGAVTLRRRIVGLLQAVLGPKARLRVYLVVMVIALVLTRSRMGNTAFFAALTSVGLFALWRLRQPSRPLVVLVISVLMIDIFVIGTWFGVEQVIDRIQQTVQREQDRWVVQDKTRIDVDREALAIIAQAPVAGMGGGTFYTVYPAWRGNDQMFMDHAHNDYLEFMIGYGVPGTALLGWFLLLCGLQASRGLEQRDDAVVFGVSFAALMAIVAMMIHAAVDFSLQIPANAAWFVVIAMLPFSLGCHCGMYARNCCA